MTITPYMRVRINASLKPEVRTPDAFSNILPQISIEVDDSKRQPKHTVENSNDCHP